MVIVRFNALGLQFQDFIDQGAQWFQIFKKHDEKLRVLCDRHKSKGYFSDDAQRPLRSDDELSEVKCFPISNIPEIVTGRVL